MYREKDMGDLRNEILSLKRQLNSARNENSLMKVKIRKLQEEIVKKNKHIEILLHPRKSSAFHKVMSENGATIVMNSLERTLRLQKLLDERNAQIKKLQGELEITRLYTGHVSVDKKRPVSVKSNNTESDKSEKIKINMPVKTMALKESRRKILQEQKNNSLTASLEGNCAAILNNDIEDTEKQNNSRCPRNSGSPESDLDRNELFCETPHKEIQQLHKYVLDVLSEVDMLKETIAEMQGDRKKTEFLLEKKEVELQKLQKEVKGFKNIRHKNSFPFSNYCNLTKENLYNTGRSADAKRKCFPKEHKKTTRSKYSGSSPRKVKQKTRKSLDEHNNGVPPLISCIDTVETQVQREIKSESSNIATESESEGIS